MKIIKLLEDENPEAVKIVADLVHALRKLENDQQRVARHNARQQVVRHLHKLRDWMDESYPVIPKSSTKRRAVRTVSGRAKELTDKGYVFIGEPKQLNHPALTVNTELLEACRAAKVPVKQLKLTHADEGRTIFPNTVGYWVPCWAVQIGANIAQLKAARTSRRTQEAREAEYRLQGNKL